MWGPPQGRQAASPPEPDQGPYGGQQYGGQQYGGQQYGGEAHGGPAYGGRLAAYRRPGGSGYGPPGVRRTRRRRRAVLIAALAAVLLAGVVAVAVSMRGGSSADDGKRQAAHASATLGASASASAPAGGAVAATTLSLSATGDIIMGNAPSALPPNNGQDFFKPVASALPADLQMGNLEQTLTADTGTAKCGAGSAGKTCFAFRTPPEYAKVLRDAGFKVMNMANNHAYDYGQQGYTNTQSALDAVGVQYTGAPGKITVVTVKGVRVAVLGFSPYPWSNSVNDTAGAAALVQQASQQADLVVVQAHMGAEGADRTHVKPGSEMFLGENRGDPIKFTHAVVDAGADLVIGHGPHVMRGVEFYKGRLIAYSLGNFAGYHALGYSGVVGVGGVLTVTLHGDGSWAGGRLFATVMVAPGLPQPDSKRQAITLVSGLSKADFPTTGGRFDDAGHISPP